MKLINQKGKIINATEKTYRLFYKKKGFKKYDPLNGDTTNFQDDSHIITLKDDKTPTSSDESLTGDVDLNLLTNKELKEILDEKGINYTTRDTKTELIEKIVGA